MLMAIWDDGTWQPIVAITGVILGSYLIVMWIGALVWTYRDIRSRTNDIWTHAIAVMVVLVFNLPGILLYMVLRPKETLAEVYDRRLGAEALLQEIHEQETCPTCRRRTAPEFLGCPYCGTALRVPCEHCQKPLQATWVICPYCRADRVFEPAAAPAQANSAAEPTAARPQPARRPSTATYTPPAPKPAATPSEGAGSAADAGS
ncbi:MAG TPA: zinc ribbon domain-containing protein [Dehalococcoidia bacterium]|nr:zinc ribbon domain-containing protein [Dehalococcoidia bacterium]